MKGNLKKRDTASVVRLCKVEQSVRTELRKPYVFIVTKKKGLLATQFPNTRTSSVI